MKTDEPTVERLVTDKDTGTKKRVEMPKSEADKKDAEKKPKPKERKWNGSNKRQGVWLKVYAEQCGQDKADATPEEQVKYMDNIFKKALPDLSKDYYVDIRIHNLDEVAAPDDPFALSIEKPHAHIYIEARGNRKRLDKFFNDLKSCGIAFRKGLDDTLLDKQIENGNAFPDYRQGKYAREYCVVYNSHEDMMSKKKGKHVYDTEDYHYSTFTREEIKEMIRTEQIVRNGFLEKDSGNDDIASITKFEHVELLNRAREVGRSGGDFDNWYYEQLPPSVRLQAHRNKLMEEYDYGIDEFLANPLNVDMTRLCLFIVGPKDIGKSGSMKRACADLGLKLYPVSAGGGTGKMDNFKYWHEVLGLDDTTVTGLMSYADDLICRAYKRNKGNPLNRTKLLYLTSNRRLNDFYWSTFGSNVPREERSDDDVGLDAFRSRFIEVVLDANGDIIEINYWLRGAPDRVKEKVRFALTILENFKRHIKEYHTLKTDKDTLAQITKPLDSLIDNDGFQPVGDEVLPFEDKVEKGEEISYNEYRDFCKSNTRIPLYTQQKWAELNIEERRKLICI